MNIRAAFFGKRTLANNCLLLLVVEVTLAYLGMLSIPFSRHPEYEYYRGPRSLLEVALEYAPPLGQFALLIWHFVLLGLVRRVIRKEMGAPG